MIETVLVSAVRTPMGKSYKGLLNWVRADDLGALAVKAALAKVPQLQITDIEDVIFGCAMPEGEQGMNIARNISFLAGIPVSSAAMTVNRFCASGLEAIHQAILNCQAGNGEVFVSGGVESMSHVPMGGFNPSLNEKLMKPNAVQAYMAMGLTAEKVAKKYNVSRKDQDQFAFGSHQKAVAAIESGVFKNEIVPIEVTLPDGSKKICERDENPRADSSLEKLAGLKPAFLEGGTVTPGNSSPFSDGAAAVIVTSAAYAKKMGLKPLARIKAFAVAGCDPSEMGMGPVPAVTKVLKRAGMKLADVDLIELNEAFAAQSVAVLNELKADFSKVNIHGGAIALGHPLGCSGARIMATLLNALKSKNKTIGLETMCVGGGQGAAVIVERL